MTLIPLIVAAALSTSADRHAAIWSGYLDHDQLAARLTQLAAAHPETCELVPVGLSHEGRAIDALIIGRGEPGPALLLTAGLDGVHLVGTEVALRIAERLLADPERMPDGVRLIVVPRVNPDAAEWTLAPGHAPQERTMRPVDNDRDGLVDEDGPADLDDNGVITVMRQARPALPDLPTHVVDHEDPRLLRAADPARGESPTHRLLIEGVDDDEDGLIGEDPIGGVDLNRNWPHRWPEHGDGAGTHPMSEPESRALAEFVIANGSIAVALTYGRHDNLIHVPDGRGRDVNPRVPLDLEPGDVAPHTDVARIFRDRTGQTRAARADIDGSFHAWLYAQRGRLSLATVVWGRPDLPEVPAAEAATPSDTTAPEPTDDTVTAATDGVEQTPPARGPRGAGARTRRAPTAAAGPRVDDGDVAEQRAWLAYSDQVRSGAGFVNWQTVEHPQRAHLGEVEVGGWVPGFRENPPAPELDDLAERHLAFVVALLERLPRVEIARIEVTQATASLWSVRVEIRNTPAVQGGPDGASLAFGTAHSRDNGVGEAMVLRMEIDRSRLVGGQRIERIAHLESGGARLLEWMVVAPEGTVLPLVVRRPGLPEVTIEIPCVASGAPR